MSLRRGHITCTFNLWSCSDDQRSLYCIADADMLLGSPGCPCDVAVSCARSATYPCSDKRPCEGTQRTSARPRRSTPSRMNHDNRELGSVAKAAGTGFHLGVRRTARGGPEVRRDDTDLPLGHAWGYFVTVNKEPDIIPITSAVLVSRRINRVPAVPEEEICTEAVSCVPAAFT